jgi:hypothetical protein
VGGFEVRFNTPEEVRVEAEKGARIDYEKHAVIRKDEDGTLWQVSLNPYTTAGARSEWKRGFDGAGPRSYETSVEWNFQYQRGAAAKRILESLKAPKLVIKAREEA